MTFASIKNTTSKPELELMTVKVLQSDTSYICLFFFSKRRISPDSRSDIRSSCVSEAHMMFQNIMTQETQSLMGNRGRMYVQC